jgi:hypothetical protein
MVVMRSRVAHRTDHLARGNRITDRHMLTMGMEYFVRKAVRIPDGYCSIFVVLGFGHDASHRRTQRRMFKIDSRLCPK